jgi:hypothetical protein
MAKLTDVSKTLSEINQNTKDTKNLLSSMLKQDAQQERQKQRDKVLNDRDDKGGLKKITSKLAAPTIKAGGGLLDMLGDFVKTLLGLGALQFLMDPKFQKALNDFIKNLKQIPDMLEDITTTLASIPVVKRLLDKGKNVELENAKKAELEKQKKLEADRKAKRDALLKMKEAEAAEKARLIEEAKTKEAKNKAADAGDNRNLVDQEAKSKSAKIKQAELEKQKKLEAARKSKADALQKIKQAETAAEKARLIEEAKAKAADAAAKNAASDAGDTRNLVDQEAKSKSAKIKQAALNKKITTDIGDIAFNDNTQRYQKVKPEGWGQMVKTADAEVALGKALELDKPAIPEAPKIETAPPKPPVVEPDVKKTKGFLSKIDDALSSSLTYKFLKGSAKVAGKLAAPVGVAVDAGFGYFDKDYKAAGYGGMDRMGLGLMEGMADVGDFGVNLATMGAGWFTGKGLFGGWGNDVDISEDFKNWAQTDTGKFLLSLGRMGENPFAGLQDGAKDIVQSNIENSKGAGGEEALMSQYMPKLNKDNWATRMGPNSVWSAPQTPEAKAELKLISERNALYDNIMKTTDPEKQKNLIEQLTKLVEMMSEAGVGGAIGNPVVVQNNNQSQIMSAPPLRTQTSPTS